MDIKIDSVGGEVTPWYMQKVEVCLSVDELDSITISFDLSSDGNVAELKKMMPGQTFSLKIDKLEFEGDFVHLSFRHTETGLEVTALGLEPLHRLRHQRLSEVKKQTRDKVVTTLLTAASVKSKKVGKVKPVAAEQVALDDDSVKLLKKLCAERNFALFWSNGTLTYGPRNVSRGGLAVKLDGGTLTDLDLDLDLSEVVTKVSLNGRDYRKADKALKVTATDSKLKKISKGTPATTLRSKGFGQLEHKAPWTLGTSTPSALQETAIAELQARAEKFARGRCTGPWNPAIKPLCQLQFENVSWPLGGPFLVSSVTHRYVGGSLETTAEFFSDALAKAETSRSGLAGAMGLSLGRMGAADSLRAAGALLMAPPGSGDGGGSSRPDGAGYAALSASDGASPAQAVIPPQDAPSEGPMATESSIQGSIAVLEDDRDRLARAHDLATLRSRDPASMTADERAAVAASRRLEKAVAARTAQLRAALEGRARLLEASIEEMNADGGVARRPTARLEEGSVEESTRGKTIGEAQAELKRLNAELAALPDSSGRTP